MISDPTIIRIPSIIKQASFSEATFYNPQTPHKQNNNIPNFVNNPRFSPSYVPPDSPYSIIKRSGNINIEEKLLNENQVLANVLKIRTKENEDFEEISMKYKINFKNVEEKVERLLLENSKLNEVLEKNNEYTLTLKIKMEEILKENTKLLELTKRTSFNNNIQQNQSNENNFTYNDNNSIDNSNINIQNTKKMEEIERDLENKTRIIISQNEQLNITIREQFKEMDAWKEKYKEKGLEVMNFENNYNNEKTLNSMLQEKIMSLSKENEKVNRLLLEKYTDSNSFNSKMKAFEEKTLSLELENQRLKQNEGFFEKEKQEFKKHLQISYAENDKLLNILDEKEREVSALKELEEKIEVLIAENNKLTDSIDKIMEKHRLERKQIDEEFRLYREKYQENEFKQGLESKLKIMLIENEKLTDIIERKNKELSAFGEIEDKIELLVKENEKLNRSNIEKRNEVDYWKKRYFDQM